jgi:hypothetical protein
MAFIGENAPNVSEAPSTAQALSADLRGIRFSLRPGCPEDDLDFTSLSQPAIRDLSLRSFSPATRIILQTDSKSYRGFAGRRSARNSVDHRVFIQTLSPSGHGTKMHWLIFGAQNQPPRLRTPDCMK